jgi:hypothetical protein
MIAFLMLIICLSSFCSLFSSGGAAFSNKPFRDQKNWPYIDPETMLWSEKYWDNFRECLDKMEKEDEEEKADYKNLLLNYLETSGIYISPDPANKEICQKVIQDRFSKET